MVGSTPDLTGKISLAACTIGIRRQYPKWRSMADISATSGVHDMTD